MLATIKTYISELQEISFDDFYQDYIWRVQDHNIFAEVTSVKTDDIMSLSRLVARLNKELSSLKL